MTATCSRVEIIKDLLSLLMCKASSKNGINTMSIQCIIQDKVVIFMVMDMMTIIMGYIGRKSLSFEINDQISIPWVGCAYQEQEFIWK